MRKISLLIAAFAICGTSFAQIPNSGFETWTSSGSYDIPTGWDNLNSMTSMASTFTCMKGTPGNPGSNFLKLTSKTVTGMGVMPGVAISGVMDMTTFQPVSGFANTARPVSLTGNWQYMAYGSDQGHVMVLLSKWNVAMSMRDTVAFVDYSLPGMAMSWASFTIPLTYKSTAIPDSAIIVLSASGLTPVNSSYLYVDNLAFSGSVPTAVASVKSESINVSIFPNPASENATILYSAVSPKKLHIKITDISGRLVKSMDMNANAGENRLILNTSNYSKGVYLLVISDAENTTIEKLVVE